MTLYIAPIVEGQTEAGCIERLLQRVWTEVLVAPIRLQVLAPSRCNRDSLLSPNTTDLADKVGEATAKLGQRLKRDQQGQGLLLLLLDAESDCPAALAPRLLATARNALPADAPVACVLAKQMLENWIVAGASTLAGKNGLPNPLPPRNDPENCNGAGWLDGQIRSKNRARKYQKTIDAEVFVRQMHLPDCRANSPSFDKLCRELEARLPPPPPSDPLPQSDSATE